MFYTTGEEVRLGDRIRIKRMIRRDQEGVVCYLPGISPRHPELEYEYVQQWAIKLDDGTVLAFGYNPKKFQPKKHIILLGRTQAMGIGPDEKLEWQSVIECGHQDVAL